MRNKSKGSDSKVGFRIDPTLKKKWQAAAKKENLSLSAYIINMMETKPVDFPTQLAAIFYYHIYTNKETGIRNTLLSKIVSFAIAAQSDDDIVLELDKQEATVLNFFFSDFLTFFFSHYPDYVPKMTDKDGQEIKLDLTNAETIEMKLV